MIFVTTLSKTVSYTKFSDVVYGFVHIHCITDYYKWASISGCAKFD